ncbi:uncharacterized protein JCM15063_002726 [Sporobolomyces koalae]|uniref:uncharacterized protein n=1 Tax=Sporobolomyces koalae TaxID=500713 RepID=UPI00317E4FC8
MQLCVACSSTLDSNRSTPVESEKPSEPITFGCGHVLCRHCARSRRSLAKACVLCQSAHDLLSTTSTRSRPQQSHSGNLPVYTLDTEAKDFVLGDESDDEGNPPQTPPPGLDPSEADLPPAYDDETVKNVTEASQEKQAEEQCNLHYIKPEETLLGLSMKYRVEGPLLCSMNRLPISTLSTTPHLLHTLPFLLLPPGATPSTSTTPLLPPAQERRRLIIRRFQIQTRCSDYSVAQAYVDQVFKQREDEAECVRTNRRARGQFADVVEVREGGELEQATEAYLADERWEREQREHARGKGKGLFGSKIRSSGQVGTAGQSPTGSSRWS